MTFHSAQSGTTFPVAPARWRASGAAKIASLAPFLVAVALQLFAPVYFAPMLVRPPDILGIPLGVVAGALILAWAALGTLIVWTTHSRLAAAMALAFLTLPSIFALILGPAIILILQNLS